MWWLIGGVVAGSIIAGEVRDQSKPLHFPNEKCIEEAYKFIEDSTGRSESLAHFVCTEKGWEKAKQIAQIWHDVEAGRSIDRIECSPSKCYAVEK